MKSVLNGMRDEAKQASNSHIDRELKVGTKLLGVSAADIVSSTTTAATATITAAAATTDMDELRGGEKESVTTIEHTSLAALSVLCRTPSQVTAALQLPWLEEVCLDFLEVPHVKDYLI